MTSRARRPTTVRKETKDTKQTTVRFDSDLFAEIAAFALRQKTTFTDAVATLCEWGLEGTRS